MKKNRTAPNFNRKSILVLLALLGPFALASCASEVNHHGHVSTDAEIKQIRKGMSKQQVKVALGSPTTTSAVDGGAFYYISSTHKHIAFLKPKVVDRKVVVIYFSNNDEVTRVAKYGLKDGKIFDFISRTTPSHREHDNVLQSFFQGLSARKSITN